MDQNGSVREHLAEFSEMRGRTVALLVSIRYTRPQSING